jgi:hypothetical protein
LGNGPAIYDGAAQLPHRYQRDKPHLALRRVCQRRHHTAKLDGNLRLRTGESHANADRDGNSHSDGDANGHSNSYAYTDGYANGDANFVTASNADANTDAETNPDTEATSDTAAAAVSL